jgi:hypothetical protein
MTVLQMYFGNGAHIFELLTRRLLSKARFLIRTLLFALFLCRRAFMEFFAMASGCFIGFIFAGIVGEMGGLADWPFGVEESSQDSLVGVAHE